MVPYPLVACGDLSPRGACGAADGRIKRRLCLAMPLLLGGCAGIPDEAPSREGDLLQPLRNLAGGFLAPPTPGLGVPARPSPMFVKLVGPRALALRGGDLLVADVTAQRLWRADVFAQTFVGIAGAPLSPDTALALGPDLSAWVLDPASRQVLRFARDGRLLQTLRATIAQPSPVALALADGGTTLLLADGMGANWSETRGGFVQLFEPQRNDTARVSGVDAIAIGREGLYLLDRLAGAVHLARRDGTVLATLGRDELLQPRAIAVDAFERVFVVDREDQELKVLQRGQPTRRIAAAALGVQRIGGIAIDERQLAVSDPLTGQVVMHRLGAGAAP